MIHQWFYHAHIILDTYSQMKPRENRTPNLNTIKLLYAPEEKPLVKTPLTKPQEDWVRSNFNGIFFSSSSCADRVWWTAEWSDWRLLRTSRISTHAQESRESRSHVNVTCLALRDLVVKRCSRCDLLWDSDDCCCFALNIVVFIVVRVLCIFLVPHF